MSTVQVTSESLAHRRKVTGAHFTPPGLAAVLAARLAVAIKRTSGTTFRVLDPSCGDGELLLAFATAARMRVLPTLTLIGIEESVVSLNEAIERLQGIRDVKLEIIPGDFLEMAESRDNQMALLAQRTRPNCFREPVDVVIANPPYVRTQILGSDRARGLARKFGLTGRVDLYHAFTVAMTQALAVGGLLGMITSNRFLTTKGGQALREFLASEFDILEILDLGDTKLFEAAVLPAVFIGRRRAPAERRSRAGQRVSFTRVYENSTATTDEDEPSLAASSVCEILRSPQSGVYRVGSQRYSASVGIFSIPDDAEHPWAMLTEEEKAWLECVDSHAPHRIEDVARVRVGIKTTADSVFIRSDWDSLPEGLRPEDELLRPILSHDHARRWRCLTEPKKHRKVLYTHEERSGRRCAIDLNQFPRAAAYLESHRRQLEQRTYIREANRNWYEIWVPQEPSAWSLPKLVFPDISPEPIFFFDNTGAIVDGDCYWITSYREDSEDTLFLIMALANSCLMTRYHELAFQNKLYSGRRRYLAQYVSRYPLPKLRADQGSMLVSVAKRLALGNVSDSEQIALEEGIERLAAKAFGVDPVGKDLKG